MEVVKQYAAENNLKLFRVSAKTGEGIQTMMNDLLSEYALSQGIKEQDVDMSAQLIGFNI